MIYTYIYSNFTFPGLQSIENLPLNLLSLTILLGSISRKHMNIKGHYREG